jgi:hypothetical protein
MYITPPIQLTFEHSSRNKAETPVTGLTFKGLPKYEPDVFDLRPDFNRSQRNERQSSGLRTVDYWA